MAFTCGPPMAPCRCAAGRGISGIVVVVLLFAAALPELSWTSSTFVGRGGERGWLSCRTHRARSLFRPTAVAVGGVPSLTEESLADRAREFVLNEGFYSKAKEELMAEDFVFFGPVVGPLNKKDYLGTLGVFKIYDAFPDLKVSASKFVQDPADVRRFWGIIRVEGTHTSDLNMGSMKVAPTGKRMVVGPQSVSVSFNDEGLVTKLTGGYVVDYRDGETGAAGAMFAVGKSVGAPMPRAWPPGKLLKFLNWVGAKMKNFPKGRSHKLDLPSAWAEQGRSHGLRTADAWP